MEDQANSKFGLGKYLLNPHLWLDWAVRTGLILGTVLVWLSFQVLFHGYQVSYSAPLEDRPVKMASSR